MDREIYLTDALVGTVLFKYNKRAKRYIIRIKPEIVIVTIPVGGNYKSAEKFFKQNREIILQKTKELIRRMSQPELPIEPLRRQAKLFLPKELERLAKEHGFRYKGVKIQKSKTRWGSCSSKAIINLSLYLMNLPSHLIEYVLLHELCHTLQMNHGPAFWALMDEHTGGKAKALRSELKSHTPQAVKG
jgi:predicted metal-dependent hydrolase